MRAIVNLKHEPRLREEFEYAHVVDNTVLIDRRTKWGSLRFGTALAFLVRLRSSGFFALAVMSSRLRYLPVVPGGQPAHIGECPAQVLEAERNAVEMGGMPWNAPELSRCLREQGSQRATPGEGALHSTHRPLALRSA